MTGENNALLEDMNDKIQIVLEGIAPIPQMQADIAEIKGWEERIDLIPIIFEEVGSLRQDVEILKEAVKLLGRHEPRLEAIEKRLEIVEQRIQ